MTTDQSRALTMLGKVQTFRVKHGSAFATGSNALARFAPNEAFIAQMEAQADDQHSGTTGAKGGTALKSASVVALRARVKSIVDTGKTVFAAGEDNPSADADLEAQMRMPTQGKTLELLTFARDLKTKVAPFEAAFVAEEMAPDFLAQLQAAIESIGGAEGDPHESALEHVGATTDLEVVMRAAIANVRSLDAPVNNKFAADAGILSEWDSASHIQVGLIGRKSDEPIVPPTAATT